MSAANSSPPVAVTLAAFTCIPAWQNGKLCHLLTLSSMGPRGIWGEGVSRQSWEGLEPQRSRTHLHVYMGWQQKKPKNWKERSRTIKGRKSTGIRRKPLDKPDSGFYNQSKLMQRDSLLIQQWTCDAGQMARVDEVLAAQASRIHVKGKVPVTPQLRPMEHAGQPVKSVFSHRHCLKN